MESQVLKHSIEKKNKENEKSKGKRAVVGIAI